MISKQMIKGMVLLAIGVLCCICGPAFAKTAISGIGGVAAHVTSNLSNIAKLITGAAYVAGFGFAVGAIVKFKAHKDNPTQVTLGQPIALLAVGAALVFMPNVFQTAGMTLFNTNSGVGSASGSAKIDGT